MDTEDMNFQPYPEAPGGKQDDGRVIAPDLDEPEDDGEVDDDGSPDG